MLVTDIHFYRLINDINVQIWGEQLAWGSNQGPEGEFWVIKNLPDKLIFHILVSKLNTVFS